MIWHHNRCQKINPDVILAENSFEDDVAGRRRQLPPLMCGHADEDRRAATLNVRQVPAPCIPTSFRQSHGWITAQMVRECR